MIRRIVLAVLFFSVSGGTLQATPKNQYWLFKPTPHSEMRPMAADRPDKTETPYTVDAGHVQAEVSLFSYTYDHRTTDGSRIDGYSIMPMLIKAGLTNWMDLELGLEPYVHDVTYDLPTNSDEVHNGFGDVVPRLKINFVGNDSGKLALGTIVFLKIPTNQDHLYNDAYEGGIIFPFGWEFKDEWSFNGQPQFNIVEDATTGGHSFEFSGTLDVAHSFTDRLGAFIEFFASVSEETGQPWIGTVDSGMTYEVIKDFLMIDAAIDVGVTRAADDMTALVGFTFRY